MEMLRTVSLTTDNWTPQTKVGLAAVVPAALTAFGLVRAWRRNRQLPPGPSGLPLFGCVRLADQTQWHRQLLKEAENYDGIFSFYFGTQLIIAVTSYDALKEMLESHEFTGRQQTPLTKKFTENRGIAMAEGSNWSHHRRLSLRILRDFGFARAETLEMVESAMEPVVRSLDAACDAREPVKLLDHFLGVSNSVIAQLLFGRHFSTQSKDFAEFCDAVMHVFSLPFLSILDMFPLLYHVVLQLPVPVERAKMFQTMDDFIVKLIGEREATMSSDENAEPACLCDAYIVEKRKAEKKGDFDTYCQRQMVRTFLEFFLAGTDTTARSVEWMLIYMAFNPDKQRLVHKELDEAVGQSRKVQMSDKNSLNYMSAVIDESYRMASLVSLGVFHRAMEDTTFRGFRIPKDALIVPHLFAVHHDASYWTQPEAFIPERFLDSSGRYKQNQRVIPFLIGRRACLGESLARIEVFLMFATIMQRFEVAPTPDSLKRRREIFEGSLGIVSMPGDYELEFTRRFID